MNYKAILILALTCAVGWAQEAPGTLHWSTEVDLVPFATGGWYGSLAGGAGHWRLRGVLTEAFPPSFFEPKGWKDGRTRAQAMLVDRFFMPGFQGPWVGTGVERWEERLRLEGQPSTVTVRSVQATLGTGWVFRMGSHLTVNPWMALHHRVGGDIQAITQGQVCRPQATRAEASVKVGWAW